MTTALELDAPPAGARCLAYTRVSKEDQARGEKTSLADQRAAVDGLAQQLGLTLAAACVFTDPGRSGGTAEGRPAFMALVRYCEQHPRPRGQPGHVLVLNDSRWGRFDDPEEAAYWRVVLRKAGWVVRFAEGDSGNPDVGVIERALHGAQASAYRRALSANSKRGLHGAARQGKYPNKAPLGYRKSPTARLVLGPEDEQRLVRYFFERYEHGATLGILLREATRRWPGLRNWCRPVIRAILVNPAYVGDVIWHDGRGGPEKSVARGAHPALVQRDLFQRVQTRLARNHKTLRHTAGGYPLRDLVTCAKCGAAYKGAGGPRGPDHDPDRYRFYRERETSKRCGWRQGTLQKRVIEPPVIGEVAKVVSAPATQRLIARELDRLLGKSDDTPQALLKERTDLEAQRRRIVEQIGRGTITEAEAEEVLRDLRGRLDAVAADLEGTRFANARRQALAAERDRLLKLAADFPAVARRLSGGALRDLLAPWLAGAVFDKEQRALTLTIRRAPVYSIGNSQERG
jgi:DNA invertase Pin-like site-specific DNA recombinase